MSDFIQDVLEAANLQFECEALDGDAYSVTLASATGRLTRRVTVAENADPPTAGQVLYHLAQRLEFAHLADDLADWCDDMDLDPADPAAQEEYDTLCSELASLREVLGDANLGQLFGGLAIHQAIAAAWPGRLTWEDA